MSKRKYSKSFEIALSAMSCAVAVVFLMLGFFSGYLLATGYIMGVIALMAPLSKQFFWGDFLAYLGTCILAVIMGAAARFWDLVPFIMFFGLHPLINALQIKFKINKWLAFAVKAVWFDLTVFVAYLLIFRISGFSRLPENVVSAIKKFLPLIICVGGTLIFFVYDYLIFKCQIAVNKIVYRIKK